MFKRVLLCHDGTSAGRRALRRGAELAIELKAHVDILAIVPDGVTDPAVIAAAAGSSCFVEESSVGLAQVLRESIQRLKDRGVMAEGHMATGDTVDQITAYAKRLAIDLIVLGHYPQSSGGFWWWRGSPNVPLAERTNCCVLVAVDDLSHPRVS